MSETEKKQNKASEKLKTLDIINQVYMKFQKDKEKFLVFRGLPNINYKLESSAARRFRNNNETSQLDFINYHKVLLDEIMSGHYKGINNEDLAHMSELELLAQVQHLGGATCLTDFSLNLLVSLWFATSPKKITLENKDEEESDGALYIVNLHSEYNRDKFVDIMALKDKEKTGLEDILTYKCEERVMTEHFWYWKPKKTNGRVNNQSSIFIFGLPAIEDTYYDVIRIDKGEKAHIRQELKTYFGVDVKTIFPDLQGFSLTANSHSSKLYKKFNHNCLDIARDYLRSRNYDACLNHLNEIKECENGKGQPVCKRHISEKKCDWTFERRYLEAVCENMKAREEYEKKKKNDDKKMGHISYNYLVNCQEKAIDQLYEAMMSPNCKIKLKCVLALFNCFYDIVICEERYLEEDFAKEDSRFNKLMSIVNDFIKKPDKKISKEYKYLINFSLLELSIFAKNKKATLGYQRNIKKLLLKKEYLNAKYLLDFFEIISKTVKFTEPSISKNQMEENKKIEDEKRKKFEWELEAIQHSIDNINKIECINNARISKFMEEIENEIAYSSTLTRDKIGDEVNRIERDAEHDIKKIEEYHKEEFKKLQKDENYKSIENHTDIFTYTVKWDYEDMKHWLQNEFGDNTPLTILCNEMKRMQESWMYRMFETAFTFTHGRSKKVEAVKKKLEEKRKKENTSVPSSENNTEVPT